MPGLFGNSRVTVQNFKIVDIKPERNLLLVKGAIPGSINSIVIIREAAKKAGLRVEQAAADEG